MTEGKAMQHDSAEKKRKKSSRKWIMKEMICEEVDNETKETRFL